MTVGTAGSARWAAAPCLAAGMLAALLVACSGSECVTCPPVDVCPTPAPTPVPAPDHSGYWRGWWAPYDLFAFTVSDNANVRNVHMDFYTTLEGCDIFELLDWDLAGPYPIEDGRATIEASREDLWAFEGTIVVVFTDEDNATATLTMTHVQPFDGCYGQQFSLTTTLTKRDW